MRGSANVFKDALELRLVGAGHGKDALQAVQGNFFSNVFVLQVVFRLLDQLIDRVEVGRLDIFSQQNDMLAGALGEKKSAAGGHLNGPRGLQVAIQLAQKAQIDVE